MIEETALVVAREDKFAYIEARRKSTCGQCSVQKGCGTGVLSNVLGKKISRVRAVNQIDAKVGDMVVVGLSEAGLLKSAFINYLLPLVFMFVFAIVARLIFGAANETIIIISALIGLLIAFRVVKKFANSIKSNPDYQPVLLRKINSLL